MFLTVEMLPWIGAAALAATLASLIWMTRVALTEAREAARRESRARAAAARQAFRAAARRSAGDAAADLR